MATKASRKTAQLRVQSDADAEIFLIGNDRQLLARGVGQLEATLPEAIYKLRIKRGVALKETLFELAGDKQIEERLGIGTVFADALSLSDAAGPAQPEFDVLTELAAEARKRLGGGRRIDLYIAGCLRLNYEEGHSSRSPLAGMRIYPWKEHANAITLNAAPAQKTLAIDGMSGDAKKWAVSAFRGKPGMYVLEMQDGDRCLRQVIPIMDAWQTWILARRVAVDEKSRVSVSVHVLKRSAGMPKSDDHARLGERLEAGEVSRLALAAGSRIYVSRGSIDDFLNMKFDNVLTGLSGAHLMLDAIDRKAQEQVAKTTAALPVEFTHRDVEVVIDNLARLLNSKSVELASDIVGLKLRAGMPISQKESRVTIPPITWRSWAALQAAAVGENPTITLDDDMFGECAWSHDANGYFAWSATRGKIGAFVKNVIETAGYGALPSSIQRGLEAAKLVEQFFPTAMALGTGKSTLQDVADRAGIPRSMLSLPSVANELSRFLKG